MSNVVADTNNLKSKKVPPDGGWGWVVVCAFSFFVVSINNMYHYTIIIVKKS